MLECAQNLACVGAEPLGLTNCLNFGNPEKPAVAWQLERGRRAASPRPARALGVPVVGGNVSLYNETEHGPIYPTPVVGMVGELPDPASVPGSKPADGDSIVLIGPFAPSLAGSELAKLRGELADGLPSDRDRARGPRRWPSCANGCAPAEPSAAHDVSDGGLAMALAEMAIAAGVGVDADLDGLVELRGCSGETALFGEGPGGVLLAVPESAAETLLAAAAEAGVDALALGRAGGDRLELAAAERELSVALSEAARAWSSLPERIEGRRPESSDHGDG